MVQIEVLLATLGAGLIIGYVAQRARMCFVGGIRDYFLVKDTHLLKAPVAFLIGAVAIFGVAYLFSSAPVWPWAATKALLPIPGAPLSGAASTPLWTNVFLAVLGGVGLGLFSVLAGGCPLRQHVMASEGDKSSISYLGGFYVGAVVFTAVILPFIIDVL
ncbi:MAG: YeeE/YedE family protein [Candidatus Bathyarchaeota archaeon]|nr:YeeE/YedE family protein [Candidatus Bathyarchaeota archaeon]